MGKIIAASFGGAGVTPRQVLQDALDDAESFETVVVVGINKDNRIELGWSYDLRMNHVGLLTFAAHNLCQDAREDT